MDFLGLGPMEVLVVLLVALIVFGPQRLVEVATNLGKAVREFRRVTSQFTRELTEDVMQEEPTKPPLSPPPGAQARGQQPPQEPK